MEQEIQLTVQKINQLQVATLTKRTLSILISNDYAGKAAMVKHFTDHNFPKYNELLKVKDRLPDLANAIGIAELGKILMVEITKFNNCYTVVRPMSADQIAQCAMSLISSSDEDRLSLEDLIIFFEGAKQGKYGRVLDHIDQHVIFEMLEQYREARHRTVLNHRDEQHTRFKSIGDLSRSSENNTQEEQSIRAAMVEYQKEQWQNEKKSV